MTTQSIQVHACTCGIVCALYYNYFTFTARPIVKRVANNEFLSEESEQVLLSPNFTGAPDLKITWLRNGEKINCDDDYDIRPDGSLYLPCVKKNHAGRSVAQIKCIFAMFD